MAPTALTVLSVARTGCNVTAMASDYSDAQIERVVDHVVVEHGTVPNDELYHSLVAGSVNLSIAATRSRCASGCTVTAASAKSSPAPPSVVAMTGSPADAASR